MSSQKRGCVRVFESECCMKRGHDEKCSRTSDLPQLEQAIQAMIEEMDSQKILGSLNMVPERAKTRAR